MKIYPQFMNREKSNQANKNKKNVHIIMLNSCLTDEREHVLNKCDNEYLTYLKKNAHVKHICILT